MSLFTQVRDNAIKRALENYPNGKNGGNVMDDHTRKSIIFICRKFAEWVRETGEYTRRDLFTTDLQRNLAEECVQKYQEYLENTYRKKNGDPLSPATIHTYLAYPCSGLGVSMSAITKAKRSSGSITRSRRDGGNRNKRGDREAAMPRNRRLVSFQRAVGLRRAELARLTVADIVVDESGYLCVAVQKGKGGKKQLQRILSKDEATVMEIVGSAGDDGRIFSSREMSNDIDLHGIRAEHGYECYQFYAEMIQNEEGYREKIQRELLARYDACNPSAPTNHREKFIRDITNPKVYTLRKTGSNYATAVINGKPVGYNRLALMAVSVLHLSHWRLDVTVTNYILGGHGTEFNS